jgi:alpha-beta hydrolase superfamily lysophospholipase
MGGLIALAALRDQARVFPEGVVSGPALNVTRGINPALIGLSRALGWVHPGMTLSNGLNPDDLCTDPTVVKAYREDPLVHDRISARLFNSMVDEGRRLRGEPEAFSAQTRLLLMHGRGDPICSAEDTERFFEGLVLAKKTLKVWPGMKHEILNEPAQAEVLDEIDRFLLGE